MANLMSPVTIPFKQLIIPYLDGLSLQSKAIGSVNAVVKDNKVKIRSLKIVIRLTCGVQGHLIGENTNWIAIRDLIIQQSTDTLSNKTALVIGAGGTAYSGNLVKEYDETPQLIV